MALERSESRRQAYREQIAQIPVEKLVFLDECGFSLNLHHLDGWVVGGQRCVERVPFNKGVNRSVLGAFSLPTLECPTGLRLLWQRLGAWNRDTFEAFLQDGLLPMACCLCWSQAVSWFWITLASIAEGTLKL